MTCAAGFAAANQGASARMAAAGEASDQRAVASGAEIVSRLHDHLRDYRVYEALDHHDPDLVRPARLTSVAGGAMVALSGRGVATAEARLEFLRSSHTSWSSTQRGLRS